MDDGLPKQPGEALVCELGREVQAGGTALLGSCWARSVVKTLAEGGDIGDRPAEGGEKQAKAPTSLESIGGRHWGSPEERRWGARRKDGWENLVLLA